MNTQGIETLLIAMLVSTLVMSLFIYAGNFILDFLKIPNPPKFKQVIQDIDTTKFENENMRKNIVSKPKIIGSLPSHQESRPEAPLS